MLLVRSANNVSSSEECVNANLMLWDVDATDVLQEPMVSALKAAKVLRIVFLVSDFPLTGFVPQPATVTALGLVITTAT